jgi:hypothetical protein
MISLFSLVSEARLSIPMGVVASGGSGVGLTQADQILWNVSSQPNQNFASATATLSSGFKGDEKAQGRAQFPVQIRP